LAIALIWVAIGILALALVAAWMVLFQLLRQNGQLLIRVDAVEAQLESARGIADRRTPLSTERPLSESRIERNGLRAGTPAPTFTLPAVNGGKVSLADYRGRRVLLVFSDPQCGPCDDLAPDLVRLHRGVAGAGLELVMVGRGDPEENRRTCEEHGIAFPVVVQRGWRLSKRYGIFATPVAFLIDEDGVIAEDVALGAQAILELARAHHDAREEAPIEM